MVPSTSSSRAIGSGKRCSAMAAGSGRRGVIGSSLAAERLIEAAHEILAEARGERRARAVEHIGDALEAGLCQGRDGVGIEAQRREREREHGRFGFAARDDADGLP